MLWYSVAMIDLATMICFLDHHETRLGRRNTDAMEEELQYMGHPHCQKLYSTNKIVQPYYYRY